MRIKYLQVYIDSLLITNHFNDSYIVKGEKLIKYLEIVKDLVGNFDSFSIIQVPREENAGADALANLASFLEIPEDLKIPVIHILYPAIDKGKIRILHPLNLQKDPGSNQLGDLLKMKKYQ